MCYGEEDEKRLTVYSTNKWDSGMLDIDLMVVMMIRVSTSDRNRGVIGDDDNGVKC